MKKCSKCGIEKELSEFNKCRAFKDGLQYQCRDCSKEAGRKCRQANPERYRKWRQANAEHRREWQREYDQTNAEHIREYKRDWYQANAEHIREYQRERSKNIPALYTSWNTMKQRCNNPKATGYKYYGGRGITYDPAWEDFEQFQKDMGSRPEGMSIDRIDVNGNYCKENCRWADAKTQANNKRQKGVKND